MTETILRYSNGGNDPFHWSDRSSKRFVTASQKSEERQTRRRIRWKRLLISSSANRCHRCALRLSTYPTTAPSSAATALHEENGRPFLREEPLTLSSTDSVTLAPLLSFSKMSLCCCSCR
ncbi:unnamed protein product [Nesidiocoris tenuis]|uniref:Uncharacterized protein n=1 Tax=Nesidiocoris tenuis TaxID=355587 RepID=A0A6H5GFD9_9HEMI|nr:unnamed protein product [Nesidiocoris tenuis]